MTPEQTIYVGRSADSILESEAGGLVHRAVVLVDLASALYGAESEWEYDDDLPGQELSRRARELGEFVNSLSLDKEGRLTLHRECGRCSGDGKTAGEDPCIECDGSGHVHAEEADG